MAVVSANKLELLQIADAVAREKSIDRSIVIHAMEDAIAKAARSRYGSETDVHAEIDPKKGELRLSRHMLVVEQVENPANQISLEAARHYNPAAQIGGDVVEVLPNMGVFRALVPMLGWVTNGLMLGRPIAPNVTWSSPLSSGSGFSVYVFPSSHFARV